MTATLAPTAAPTAESPPVRSRREPIALAALLIGTAVLYLWNLGASGWANSYYSGAVQAMTMSWKAFFFASLDAGNVITVDKPPAALWVMALSARIFGLSSWSILVPEALMGVATVALIYATVRRAAGPRAALVAGAAMALTPVAVVMFRFNNPDALLVLLMVAAAYATTRAIEKAGTRWLLLAGALIGFGFITKMAQALIVLPALALAYLLAAPTGFWQRIRQLLAGGAAMVVAAGWWIATVELWPADSRPYIGGSTANSVMELALGYNGLGRIFGNFRGARGGAPGPELAAGPPPGGGEFGGGGPGGFGGQAGLLRLFNEEIGGQVAWLLPAALVLLVAGLWLLRKAPRTDRTRAALVVWGGWTVVTAVVFSFAEGIFHGYYTVALAPGIAALVGIGGRELWRQRGTWPGRITLVAILAATAATAWVMLGRSPDFLPWLRCVVVAVAAVAALTLLLGRRWAIAGLVAVLLTGAIAPAAYAVQTVATAHVGPMPTAGPAVERQQRQDGGGPRMMGRGPGEEQGTVDAAMVTLLQQAGTSWSAAAPDSHTGVDLALASGTNVMSIGGFTGSDPAPTLAQFQAYVAEGKIHWFVDGGGGPGPGQRRQSEISTWVRDNFASTTVGGRTVYDLTTPLH